MANGWLSPDGEFFPCDIGKHHDKAKEIITDYSETWQADVWLQITPTAAFSEKGATAAQIEWLENSGSWLYKADAEILRQIGKERVVEMPRLDNSSIVIIDNFDLALRPDPGAPVDLCADCWLHKVIKVKLEDFEIDHPPYEEMGAYWCYVCGDPLTEADNDY